MLGKETTCILPSRNPCSEVQPWLYVCEACEETARVLRESRLSSARPQTLPQRASANGTICSYP